ncbi:MAG: sialidase family protein, partial [Chloroflexota bacterium]
GAYMNTQPFYHAEEMFSSLPDHPSCHASTIVCLPDGDLLTAFYAGSVEKAADVVILLSRYRAWDGVWSPPEVVVDLPDKSVGNPVLFLTPSGILWFFYLIMQGNKWYHCTIDSMRSTDYGASWEPDNVFRADAGWTTRNNLVVLDTGAILFPLSDNVEGHSIFMVSEDGGRTWQQLGKIVSDPHNEQPAVVQLSDGSLLAYMRTAGKGGRCWQSRSFDRGRSWTLAEPGPFSNPNSAMAMIRLESGGLVLVYNDSDNYRYRTPLNIALSLDDGVTWPFVRSLETREGEFTYLTTRLDNSDSIEFSYPAIAQDREGYIHVTYTNCRENIKHVVVNEAWIQQRS